MAFDLEEELRTPGGYDLGHSALHELQHVEVWPTVLNYELWLHVLADPEGTLALEVQTLLGAGERITDAIVEDLSRAYLPRAKLEAQVGEAGDALSAHLAAAALTIDEARGSAIQFGAELDRAKVRLSGGPDPAALAELVDDLAEATDLARSQTHHLEGRLAASSAEVRKLREALELARQEAATDGLSNLANRRAFDEELRRLCGGADADRPGPVILALLDIDHFKSINDVWGHQTGDQVIRFVASVISQVGAPPSFAARFGGDEFAMIFPGEPAGQVERRLRDMIAEIAARKLKRRDTNEPLGDITLSVGFAEHRPGETPSALMERADQALYASKRAGRNRVTGAAQAPPSEVLQMPQPKPKSVSLVGGARARVLGALRR
jgi:diguanylate cyclase